MKINVYEITGEYAIASKGGQRLYEIIKIAIQSEGIAEVDFTGVGCFGSRFCHYAIGQLLRAFSPARLNEAVELINLAPYARLLMREVIDHAKEFYGHK